MTPEQQFLFDLSKIDTLHLELLDAARSQGLFNNDPVLNTFADLAQLVLSMRDAGKVTGDPVLCTLSATQSGELGKILASGYLAESIRREPSVSRSDSPFIITRS